LNTLLNISIGDWINIIIASITLLTAIIALLTINEMRKQRVHSYFPDINMANFSFYVYKTDYDNETNSIFLHFFKNKKEENEKIDGFNELKIGINNIGFGVAKNVRWDWDFDLTQAQKVICKDKNIKWVKDEDDVILIDLKKLNIEWALDVKEDNIGGAFNFILPYSNENRETEIVIPSYYIDLYWLYLVIQIENDFKEYAHDYFPQLELKVRYTDIHSNEQEKTFLIGLDFDMISTLGENVKELGKFRFEIFEK
jgi:hypothetical protein